MDAHLVRCAALVAAIVSLGANFRTTNFVVSAPSSAIAEQIGRAAEQFRRQLAIDWLGQEMPNWSQPCPISAQVGEQLGAGGATSFVFEHGEVFGWRMSIQGSLVRILDSVLPHEVTHTVFATHFRQPLPRWADEGACTTVEHTSEKAKQQTMLIEFLRTGRGIAFNQMFAMKDYPHDVMPLYSQGYSVARYLVAQGGRRKFLDFLADGLRDENWGRAIRKAYGVNDLASLQNTWLAWVRKGSPSIGASSTPALVAVKASPSERLARSEANNNPRATEAATPDTPAASAPANRSANEPSVYEVAAAANKKASAAGGRTDNWHPRGDAADATSSAVAVADAPTEPAEKDRARNGQNEAYQATRPQAVQRPRQVILEWSRPFQSAEDTRKSPDGYSAAASSN